MLHSKIGQVAILVLWACHTIANKDEWGMFFQLSDPTKPDY